MRYIIIFVLLTAFNWLFAQNNSTSYASPKDLYRRFQFEVSANQLKSLKTGILVEENEFIYFEIQGKIRTENNGNELFGDGSTNSGLKTQKYLNIPLGSLVCIQPNVDTVWARKMFVSPLNGIDETIYKTLVEPAKLVGSYLTYLPGNYFISKKSSEILLEINDSTPLDNKGKFSVEIYTIKLNAHLSRNIFNNCPYREPKLDMKKYVDCQNYKWSKETALSSWYHGVNDAFRGEDDNSGCQCVYDSDLLIVEHKHEGSFDIGFWEFKGNLNSVLAKHRHLILDVIPHDVFIGKFGTLKYNITNIYCNSVPTLFLIDVSGSMSQDDKIGQATQSALSTIDNIKTDAKRSSKKPEIGIMVFSGSCVANPTQLIQPFSQNLDEVKKSIGKIPSPNGETPLPQAIAVAEQELENRVNQSGQCGTLIILSDGQSTCGAIRPSNSYVGKYTKQVCGQTGKQGSKNFTYYTVGFGLQPGSVAERDLQYLAFTSGGKYFNAQDQYQLTRSLQKINRIYASKTTAQSNLNDINSLELFNSGVYFINTQQYDTALIIFKKFVASNPSDSAGLYNYALMCEANERYKSAAKYYEQYLQVAVADENKASIQERIETMRKDYDIYVSYVKQVIQSDLAYLEQHFNQLQRTPNAVPLAGEFSGFIEEKQPFYALLAETLEMDEQWLKQYSKEISQALKDATYFLSKKPQQWDLDGISMIGNVYEPLSRLAKKMAN